MSIAPRRSPDSPLGEMPCIVDERVQGQPAEALAHLRRARLHRLSGSARSMTTWSSGPASQGQSSGKGCREHVITRQPALEKRFTVACPMPRLAPVRIRVRRSPDCATPSRSCPGSGNALPTIGQSAGELQVRRTASSGSPHGPPAGFVHGNRRQSPACNARNPLAPPRVATLGSQNESCRTARPAFEPLC